MKQVSPNNLLVERDKPEFFIPENSIISNKSMIECPEGAQIATFGMGCFWGVERLFWQQKGVISTSAGYCGGHTKYPTYKEVCTGDTGHAEVVRIFFNPEVISYRELLKLFWENHNPTQGMRQGGDIGTQYRSVIFTYNDSQLQQAEASKIEYANVLKENGHLNPITTEIKPMMEYYFAEEYHQQYLEKNPEGYCGLGGIEGCRID